MKPTNKGAPSGASSRPWQTARPLAPVTPPRAANDNTPEWRLQAAAVRRLRSLPEYGRRFLIAGDMNAGKRGPQAIVQAKATGLAPGEPDLRVYLPEGQLMLIEYKTTKGRLSAEQKTRHAALALLGHPVEVIWAADEEDCAAQTENAVRTRLG